MMLFGGVKENIKCVVTMLVHCISGYIVVPVSRACW